MRTLIHVLLGALAGLSLGVLAPIAAYFYLSWRDPVGMRQGGGTVFALLPLLTAPLGAAAGAVWGYERIHPPARIVTRGPRKLLADFEEQFGHFSLQEQREALLRILPLWFRDYRHIILIRIASIAVPAAFVRGQFLMLLLVISLFTVGGLVVSMRSTISKIRATWGDSVVDQCGPLPYSLRPIPGLPMNRDSHFPD